MTGQAPLIDDDEQIALSNLIAQEVNDTTFNADPTLVKQGLSEINRAQMWNESVGKSWASKTFPNPDDNKLVLDILKTGGMTLWDQSETGMTEKDKFSLSASSPEKSGISEIIDAYKDPSSWGGASLDRLSEETNKISASYNKKGTALWNSIMKGEISMEVTQVADNFVNTGKHLKLFSNTIKWGMPSFDFAVKGYETYQVAKKNGPWKKVAFEKGMEFIGEGIGAFTGGLIVTETLPMSAGVSLVAAPTILVGTTATGGYLFKYLAKKIECGANIIEKNIWGP